MKCPKCKSFDVIFDEKITPIIYLCNGCGRLYVDEWIEMGERFGDETRKGAQNENR